MLSKDTAICIRAVDFSETSQIVTLFARDTGKISAIAKGSKRAKSAFDGPIEVFAHGRIVFSASNKEKLATLTEFQQQPAFALLTGNLFALNCCLFATELINSLTQDYDPHPQLFDSFLKFLGGVQDSLVGRPEKKNTLALLIYFQLTLLKEIGLQPVLDSCANCKTRWHGHPGRVSTGWKPVPHEVFFSSSANSLICRDCEAAFPDRIKISPDSADALSNIQLLGEKNKNTLNEIEKILIAHFTELLHRPPKMAKHILQT